MSAELPGFRPTDGALPSSRVVTLPSSAIGYWDADPTARHAEMSVASIPKLCYEDVAWRSVRSNHKAPLEG
jgi:hypothetical protein